ncbi:hypothetical protein [Paraconexibacter algicola]|uniref:Uncharacterized protein n=1 Tax=Paraconexibacter algicola TaxID=2133960 RepID=A0A2T4UK93_9ACTN|nr:hypothetical protein [Paraconexibacter algicola]PTL59659.1 hypothetical protein C7Y72_08350 [Paraconexibacter algicola]
MVVAVLLALSVAVTVNVFVPSVAVSSDAPSATVPTQDFSPLPPVSSAQENDAFTSAPRAYVAPSAGRVTVTVGLVTSTTM